MPVYLCRWPNGDAAVVHAVDREDAAILLDEFGNADEAELSELENLLIGFRLEDNGSLQVDQWGGSTREEIFETAYPRLEAALAREAAKGWEPDVRPIPEPLRAAVLHERQRLMQDSDEDAMPQTRSELGREVQKSLGAPAALITRLVERVGEKVLKKAKTKGPKH